MSTNSFDESKIRRQQGRFAEKPHAEAVVDLDDDFDVAQSQYEELMDAREDGLAKRLLSAGVGRRESKRLAQLSVQGVSPAQVAHQVRPELAVQVEAICTQSEKVGYSDAERFGAEVVESDLKHHMRTTLMRHGADLSWLRDAGEDAFAEAEDGQAVMYAGQRLSLNHEGKLAYRNRSGNAYSGGDEELSVEIIERNRFADLAADHAKREHLGDLSELAEVKDVSVSGFKGGDISTAFRVAGATADSPDARVECDVKSSGELGLSGTRSGDSLIAAGYNLQQRDAIIDATRAASEKIFADYRRESTPHTDGV